MRKKNDQEKPKDSIALLERVTSDLRYESKSKSKPKSSYKSNSTTPSPTTVKKSSSGFVSEDDNIFRSNESSPTKSRKKLSDRKKSLHREIKPTERTLNASEEVMKTPKEKFRRTRSRSTDTKRNSKKFLKPASNYGSKLGGFSYIDPTLLRTQLARQPTETSDSVSVPSNRQQQLSDNLRPSITRTKSKISDSSTENLTNSTNSRSNRALEHKKAKFSKTNQIITVPSNDSPEVNIPPDTPIKHKVT